MIIIFHWIVNFQFQDNILLRLTNSHFRIDHNLLHLHLQNVLNSKNNCQLLIYIY